MIRSHFKGVLVEGNKTYAEVTRDIALPTETKPSRWWYAARH